MKKTFFLIILIIQFCLLNAQNNFVNLEQGESIEHIIAKAANVIPSQQQLMWQEREFIAFIHFGTNTFTNREWGEGNENPAVFDPDSLDARQWAKVVRDAGMKMIIITAKHHDGLCLWPTKTTEHSIKNSPYKNGKGDVVGELAAACKEYGLKFGIYVSPWDRHEKSYGTPEYNTYFCAQLRELLSNYGEVSEVWFDGACGEGTNGKKQVYDWQTYYKIIRELQPNAVIFGMGPDVRWVGTESGYGRLTEWSVLPDVLRNPDAVAAASQQNPVDGAFIPGDLTGDDLGSREKLKGATSLVWYPAETDVSIRPGWFYHAGEDQSVKTPEKLVDIYYSSVGRNSLLLLNIPPDKHGRIHHNDFESLMGMKKILDSTFSVNLVLGAMISQTPDASVQTYSLPKKVTFDRLLLQEKISQGQRIEKFRLEAWDGEKWRLVTEGTTVGYKRLLRFPVITSDKVKLVIEQSRAIPMISNFGLFKASSENIKETSIVNGQDVVSVNLSNACSAKYYGEGSNTLANKRRGSMDFHDGQWLGFEGTNMIAVLDLGRQTPISRISAGFLQQQGAWIFLPENVEFAVSGDGKNWKSVGSVQNSTMKDDSMIVKDNTVSFNHMKTRFVRVTAKSLGPCPNWHEGKGSKSWIFADEIIVN